MASVLLPVSWSLHRVVFPLYEFLKSYHVLILLRPRMTGPIFSEATAPRIVLLARVGSGSTVRAKKPRKSLRTLVDAALPLNEGCKRLGRRFVLYRVPHHARPL
jgi:hypothetical protein